MRAAAAFVLTFILALAAGILISPHQARRQARDALLTAQEGSPLDFVPGIPSVLVPEGSGDADSYNAALGLVRTGRYREAERRYLQMLVRDLRARRAMQGLVTLRRLLANQDPRELDRQAAAPRGTLESAGAAQPYSDAALSLLRQASAAAAAQIRAERRSKITSLLRVSAADLPHGSGGRAGTGNADGGPPGVRLGVLAFPWHPGTSRPDARGRTLSAEAEGLLGSQAVPDARPRQLAHPRHPMVKPGPQRVARAPRTPLRVPVSAGPAARRVPPPRPFVARRGTTIAGRTAGGSGGPPASGSRNSSSPGAAGGEGGGASGVAGSSAGGAHSGGTGGASTSGPGAGGSSAGSGTAGGGSPAGADPGNAAGAGGGSGGGHGNGGNSNGGNGDHGNGGNGGGHGNGGKGADNGGGNGGHGNGGHDGGGNGGHGSGGDGGGNGGGNGGNGGHEGNNGK
jgi:hypothetical protein